MGLIGSWDTHARTYTPPNPLSFIMKEVEMGRGKNKKGGREREREKRGERREGGRGGRDERKEGERQRCRSR